jgi:hypothetical protein
MNTYKNATFKGEVSNILESQNKNQKEAKRNNYGLNKRVKNKQNIKMRLSRWLNLF